MEFNGVKTGGKNFYTGKVQQAVVYSLVIC